ncbi:MAG: hypothetical protein HN383_04580 [Verrucomicrobia bacterium]|nr:hypothetical protein [Verrucomicrobiota bacterium]MBT7700349.1 hypothetical protein [Verrucomicrobiota bacterium]
MKITWLCQLEVLRGRVKAGIGLLWWYSALQFVFSKVENLVNLYVGAFLMVDLVSREDLGAVVPFRMIIAFAALPMGVLTRTAVKFINTFHVGEQRGRVKALLRDLAAVALVLSVLALVVLSVGQGFFQARMKFDDPLIYWVLVVTLILSLWMPVLRVAAQGLMRFRHMILSGVVRPIVYLILMLLLLKRFQLLGYLVALLGAACGVAVYLVWSIREYIGPGIEPASYGAEWGKIRRYGVNVGSVALLLGFAAIVEPWTIRNFATQMDSAGYYVAFMFGQTPLYLAAAFTPFLFPLISQQHERGEKTDHMLFQSVVAVLLIGAPLLIFFVSGGEWLLGLRVSWRQYMDYAPLLWKVSIVSILQCVLGAFIAHENACSRFHYVKWFVPILIAEIALLYGLMGWHVFRPWVPGGVWDVVQGVVEYKLGFAVWMMVGTRVVLVLAAGLCFWGGSRRSES